MPTVGQASRSVEDVDMVNTEAMPDFSVNYLKIEGTHSA